MNTSPGVLGVATRTATRGLGPSAGSETWGPTQPPRAARCSSQDTARPRPRRRDPAPEGRPGSATPPVPGSAHTLLPPCGTRLSASSHLRLDPCFFVVVFAVICLPPPPHLFPACASAGCGGRGVHPPAYSAFGTSVVELSSSVRNPGAGQTASTRADSRLRRSGSGVSEEGVGYARLRACLRAGRDNSSVICVSVGDSGRGAPV